jgi:tetratricopeptide (TPR) repeat protein
MHREYFVEANIRAIFWLSKYEAKQCSRFAPDFWAFRHKVVEFPELPPRNKKTRTDPSSGSIHNLYAREGIDFQERMEAADQFYALGSIDDAILNYRKTLRKYPGQTAINLQIAEIYLAMGRVTTAKRLLAKAARGNDKRGGFLRELTRLTQTANTIKPRHGGLYEIEDRE